MFQKYRVWIIIGIVILLALVFFTYKSCSRPEVSPVPQQVLKDAKDQIIDQYKLQLQAKENETKDLRSRLLVSESKYASLAKENEVLRNAKANIKVPVTNAETRSRFVALGFVPLPVK